ncbi:MAG: site-2 protease family protein [Planctomycetes bacterium]|nr:site-2 protease family protein [Planctomycetota bacterium]
MGSGWWVAETLHGHQYGFLYVVAQTFWVIFSITLHELSHGWAALWEGDDTPKQLGRMTWNPVVHMGMVSLIAFVLIGIAWGVMPVNPRRFRHGYKGDSIVAAAGPAMNLVLALIAATLWFVVFRSASGTFSETETYQKILLFLIVGAELNLVLLLLNLVPIPPLDGSNILAGLSRPAREFYSHPEIGQYSMFALVALFYLGGKYLWRGADIGLSWYFEALNALF